MKYALITGASRGLGFAFAEAFAGAGYNLILCARNEYHLYGAMEKLYKQFPEILIKARPADLAIQANAEEFSAWAAAIEGELDVLINNAGSFLPGRVHTEEAGTLEAMLQNNLLSAYYVTRGVLPKMKAQQRGHIFNITSIAGLQAYPNGGSYSISKFAMEGLGKNLRQELMPLGIKVTNVAPGAVYTDSWAGSGIDPSRIMQAADIATMVLAAASLSPQACVEEIIIRPQLGDLP